MSISLGNIILGDHCQVYVTCHWPKHHYAIQDCKSNQWIQHSTEFSMPTSEKIRTGNIFSVTILRLASHILKSTKPGKARSPR